MCGKKGCLLWVRHWWAESEHLFPALRGQKGGKGRQSVTVKDCVGGDSQTRVYACPSIDLLKCQSHMVEGLCDMGYRQEKTRQG